MVMATSVYACSKYVVTTICKPLELISKQALTTGVFLSECKNGNIVPYYKKDDKQNLKNDRPVSLLSIC